MAQERQTPSERREKLHAELAHCLHRYNPALNRLSIRPLIDDFLYRCESALDANVAGAVRFEIQATAGYSAESIEERVRRAMERPTRSPIFPEGQDSTPTPESAP